MSKKHFNPSPVALVASVTACSFVITAAATAMWDMKTSFEAQEAAAHEVNTRPAMTLTEVMDAAKEDEGDLITVVQPSVKLYDVPLNESLQFYIIDQAAAHGIDPAVIFGIIGKESQFKADALGDNGKSFGLMQIQARFHQERMERLECCDMLDPYQNVTVGIDFFAELLEKYDGNTEKALIAYNCGVTGANRSYFSKGIYSNKYSKAVMEIAAEVGETK